MSSVAVRTEVTDWLNANYSATPWFDMSFHYDIDEISANQRDPFMLVQFISAGENISSLGPGNCWREDGGISFHVCGPVGGDTMALLAICEGLQNSLKGRRLGVTVIESVSPPTDAPGATIDGWQGNWHSFSMFSAYVADHDPV